MFAISGGGASEVALNVSVCVCGVGDLWLELFADHGPACF